MANLVAILVDVEAREVSETWFVDSGSWKPSTVATTKQTTHQVVVY